VRQRSTLVHAICQLARRFAKPRDDEDQRGERPRHAFATRRQRFAQEFVEAELLDQFQRQPRPAELPAVLHAHARAIDLDEPRRNVGRDKRPPLMLLC
jgi:hypothetical protein